MKWIRGTRLESVSLVLFSPCWLYPGLAACHSSCKITVRCNMRSSFNQFGSSSKDAFSSYRQVHADKAWRHWRHRLIQAARVCGRSGRCAVHRLRAVSPSAWSPCCWSCCWSCCWCFCCFCCCSSIRTTSTVKSQQSEGESVESQDEPAEDLEERAFRVSLT